MTNLFIRNTNISFWTNEDEDEYDDFDADEEEKGPALEIYGTDPFSSSSSS